MFVFSGFIFSIVKRFSWMCSIWYFAGGKSSSFGNSNCRLPEAFGEFFFGSFLSVAAGATVSSFTFDFPTFICFGFRWTLSTSTEKSLHITRRYKMNSTKFTSNIFRVYIQRGTLFDSVIGQRLIFLHQQSVEIDFRISRRHNMRRNVFLQFLQCHIPSHRDSNRIVEIHIQIDPAENKEKKSID